MRSGPFQGLPGEDNALWWLKCLVLTSLALKKAKGQRLACMCLQDDHLH